MNNPFLFGGNATVVPSTTLVNFCSLNPAPGAVGWGTGNAAARFYIRKPCEVSHWTVWGQGDPGAGNSWDIELVAYDSSDTEKGSLVATLSNGVLTDSSAVGDRIRLNPGDYIVLRSTPTSGPSALTRLTWCFIMDHIGVPYIQLPVASINPSTSAVRYAGSFFGQYVPSASVGASNVGRCSVAMRVKELHIDVREAPGVGKTWTAVLFVNGSSTGITVSITGNVLHAETTGLDILVPADAEIYYRFTPAVSPQLTYHMLNMVAIPVAPGHYPISISTGAVTNSATGWSRGLSTYTNITASTNGINRNITPAKMGVYFKNHRCRVSTDPGGAGKKWDNRLRSNGSNLNSLVSITNGNTSAEDLTNIDYVFDAKGIEVEIAPASTPAAITTHYYSMASYIPPAVPLML